jgi:hypothetical protein
VLAPTHERLNFNTPGRSVPAQSDAGGSPVSVVSVGAVCSATAAAAARSTSNESCNDTSNATIQFFSSRGPTLDGRAKPDIVAVDGVSVTGAGSFGSLFFGTSASVAHLGGVAALMLQSAPCLLNRTSVGNTAAANDARARLRNLILTNAVALSSTRPDNTFGFGRVDAFAALQPTLPTRTGRSTLVVDGNTPLGASLTADQLGFRDPNQCALTRLSWTGGCGTSPGTTMTCPFGPSSVSVGASNNGVGFAATTDLDITVTDFTTTVAPSSATVSPGRSATFVVSVAPVGGAYSSPVALSCNTGTLPPGVTCSFSPDSVTPGAAGAQSVMTVATTASSMAPPTVEGPRDDLDGWPRLTLPPVFALWFFALTAALAAARTLRRFRPALAVAGVVCIVGVGVTLVRVSAAAPASAIAIFPGAVTFGSQTVSTSAPAQLVRATNTGADPLTMTISVSGDFSQVNTCSNALNSGESCTIAVTFTPTTTGTRSGTLTLLDNAPGSPHSVSLSGTGAAPPASGSGTPTGTYTVTVNGTNGTLVHTSTVSLTVQ